MLTENFRGVKIPRRFAAAITLVSLGIAACDFSVTNPGPLQDQALDNEGAHLALVTGAQRVIADGLNDFARSGVVRAREIQPSGDTNVRHEFEIGVAEVDDRVHERGFGDLQQARWVADEAIRRFLPILGTGAESYAPLAEAYLWTGYANRILGEHMCHAVFDGGPAEPYKNHLTLAIEHFTRAAEIAARAGSSDLEMAAVAGRAAAHLYLGDYGPAEQDASQIPVDFVHVINYYSENSPSYTFVTQISGAAVRGISTWNTVYENYYLETGDPRAAWGFDPTYPTGETPRGLTWGEVPFFYPLKYFLPRTPAAYTDFDSRDGTAMRNLPVNLASGREMRLIIAEVSLQNGDWQTAMEIINGRRAELISETTSLHAGGTPLEPFGASTLEEAWTALKRERGIELWMEARRIGDLRRWREQGTPGELHPLEYIPQEIVDRWGVSREQDVCIPIPLRERETNPNIPLDFSG